MKRVVVFLIVGVVFFGISAQRADAQALTVAKLVGTWDDNRGNTWVFNANGTLTIRSMEFKFGVTDTKVFFQDSADYGKSGEDVQIYNISISSDGRTIILDRLEIRTRSSSSSIANVNGNIEGILLIKK